MKKEKTVTVTCCDRCIRESVPVWKCAHCSKDVCDQCGENWQLFSEKPRSFERPLFISTHTLPSAAKFSAFICNDCSKHEMCIPLLRFGFEERETRTAGSIIPQTGTSGRTL